MRWFIYNAVLLIVAAPLFPLYGLHKFVEWASATYLMQWYCDVVDNTDRWLERRQRD